MPFTQHQVEKTALTNAHALEANGGHMPCSPHYRTGFYAHMGHSSMTGHSHTATLPRTGAW